MLRSTFRPGPIGAPDRRTFGDLAVHGFGAMSGECSLSRIERDRLIRHRVRIDDHRARSDTAGIDNAPDHQSRDRRPIWIFRDRNGYPVVIVGGSSPARVVALPAAAQTDVAVAALRRRDGDSAAPVRHVL